MHTRAFFIPPSYLGIWYPTHTGVCIECFDPEELEIFNIEKIPTYDKSVKIPYFALGTSIAQFSLSKTMPQGKHHFEIPDFFHTLDELLIVGEYQTRVRNDPRYAIYIVSPKDKVVTVLPQKWFSWHTFTKGDQWISRVIRDFSSGSLFGNGLHLDFFELNEEGTDIKRWIRKEDLKPGK
jgi:hypothetical protein